MSQTPGPKTITFKGVLPCRLIAIHTFLGPEFNAENIRNESRQWGYRVEVEPLVWAPIVDGKEIKRFDIYTSIPAFPDPDEALKSAAAQWRQLEQNVDRIVPLEQEAAKKK